MKVLQGIVLVVLAALLSVSAFVAAAALKWSSELPSLDGLYALEFSATNEVFARDGTTQIGVLVPTVGEDQASTDRTPVSLDEVSAAALQAIVAYEDDQFFEHYGFDLPAIARAFYEEFLSDSGRGGSTITTQVIKNTVLADIADERSIERKAKEVLLAIELERRLTKPEILQTYVNVVFWGGNVYGIRAAAQTYFGKDPSELNLSEGLYLARLIPFPNSLHDDFEGTRASMRTVLDKMVRQGTISSATAERTWRYPLEPRGWSVEYAADGSLESATRTGEGIVVRSSVSSELSKDVMAAVRTWLIDRFGVARVFGSGGLRVTTTIDVQAQRAADAAVRTAAEQDTLPAGAQVAVTGIDPATGEVLAMAGGRPSDAAGETFNRVLQAQRQPGSSFKPIVYATAIERGGFTQAQLLIDEETTFDPPGSRDDYTPENHDEEYIGVRTIREHLNLSRNIPAVKALEAATPEAVAQYATELGYDVSPFYALALGGFETTPLQHASAIAAFANAGERIEPHFVSRVEDAAGNVLYEAVPRRTQVWDRRTAYIVLDMMHGNVIDRNPTAFSWRGQLEGRWTAGKTGTTNDDRDIWFVGVTPGLVGAVWIGNDGGGGLPEATPTGDRVSSSRQPIYVWKDFAEAALRGTPADADGFPVPEGIEFLEFDRSTGALAPEGTRGAFREGTELPNEARLGAITVQIPVDTRTGMRADSTTPAQFLEVIEVPPAQIEDYLPPSEPGDAAASPSATGAVR